MNSLCHSFRIFFCHTLSSSFLKIACLRFIFIICMNENDTSTVFCSELDESKVPDVARSDGLCHDVSRSG